MANTPKAAHKWREYDSPTACHPITLKRKASRLRLTPDEAYQLLQQGKSQREIATMKNVSRCLVSLRLREHPEYTPALSPVPVATSELNEFIRLFKEGECIAAIARKCPTRSTTTIRNELRKALGDECYQELLALTDATRAYAARGKHASEVIGADTEPEGPAYPDIANGAFFNCDAVGPSQRFETWLV